MGAPSAACTPWMLPSPQGAAAAVFWAHDSVQEAAAGSLCERKERSLPGGAAHSHRRTEHLALHGKRSVNTAAASTSRTSFDQPDAHDGKCLFPVDLQTQ